MAAAAARFVVVAALLIMLTLDVHAGHEETTLYDVIPFRSSAAPESVKCREQCSTCRNRVLRCPRQCPSRSHVGPGKSSCFIDCSPKCEATCKHRKPRCWGYGAVCYDPRFVGGDGVMFYFHGRADQDFCIVSDHNLHVNAHFIGKRPAGRSRDYTWVQALGLLFASHTFTIATKKVPHLDEGVDQLILSYDGEPILLEAKSLAAWTSPSAEITVERVAEANSVEIRVKDVMRVTAQVKAITEEENRIHHYQIPDDDCFAHLDLQFHFYNLSARVDGVLGQTYQPNFQNRVKLGVPMPVMGGDEKFLSSSLLSADCRNSQFNRGATPDSSHDDQRNIIVDVAGAAACSSGKGGSGILCRK